jgi:hypothetical protein
MAVSVSLLKHKKGITMKSLAFTLFIIGALLTQNATAETVAGYTFEKYPAKIYTGKKAPLKLGEWRLFRTRITDAYKHGEIGFGGSYVVTMWGCGTGCISGAMIDKKTGTVYGLPVGEDTPLELGCYSVEDEMTDERLHFYPDSRLFITRNCEQEQIAETDTAIQKLTYFVNVWNEKTKKFELIKEVKQSKTVTTE